MMEMLKKFLDLFEYGDFIFFKQVLPQFSLLSLEDPGVDRLSRIYQL
jgi:hypothetical protein